MAAKLAKKYFKAKKKTNEKSNFSLKEIKNESNQVILLFNIFFVHPNAQQFKTLKKKEKQTKGRFINLRS